MKDILDQMDNEIGDSDALVTDGVKFYGLCDPMIKGTQTHPVTIDERKQVAINDRFDGIVFHRLLNDGVSDSEEHSFGSVLQKMHTQVVRTVVAVKVSKTKTWIDEFINAIPRVMTRTGYKLINIGNITKNTDQDAIYNTEFSDSGYEKHRANYNIYALEYPIEYILC